MDPNELREHLAQLHEELKSAPQVDAASAPLLGELMEDLQRLLANAPSTPSFSEGPQTATQSAPSLPERLEKVAVLFEVDHPTLAASSRRLVDLLGKVGL
jgi:hypothetical protein